MSSRSSDVAERERHGAILLASFRNTGPETSMISSHSLDGKG
jgi:hypothetical protein